MPVFSSVNEFVRGLAVPVKALVVQVTRCQTRLFGPADTGLYEVVSAVFVGPGSPITAPRALASLLQQKTKQVANAARTMTFFCNRPEHHATTEKKLIRRCEFAFLRVTYRARQSRFLVSRRIFCVNATSLL